MSTKVVPGTLIAAPDAEGVAREASQRMARAICEAIEARGKAFVALSGGGSPLESYRRLAKEPRIDWSKVEIFQVDERAVPATDDRCNWKHAKEAIVDRAKITADRAHPMNGAAKDLAAAANEYEALLKSRLPKHERTGAPSFDLMVMGIGDDGHTASLFPGDPATEITDRFVVEVAMAKMEPKVPRLTVTPPVIEAAKSLVVIVMGRGKNAPLERVWLVAGSVSDTPARAIREGHGAITWVIDRAAGGLE